MGLTTMATETTLEEPADCCTAALTLESGTVCPPVVVVLICFFGNKSFIATFQIKTKSNKVNLVVSPKSQSQKSHIRQFQKSKAVSICPDTFLYFYFYKFDFF